jgi:predicted acyl esterase
MIPLCAFTLRWFVPAAAGNGLVPEDIKTDDDIVTALRAHYSKPGLEIPMRDGVKLHTDVWRPKPKPNHADERGQTPSWC